MWSRNESGGIVATSNENAGLVPPGAAEPAAAEPATVDAAPADEPVVDEVADEASAPTETPAAAA